MFSKAADGFSENYRRVLIELSVRMTANEQRMIELREDMNKRFEQVDKRFEQVEHSIDRVYTIIAILCSIFAALVGGLFWYILGERKTQMDISESIRQKISNLEAGQVMLQKIMNSLKELATKDEKVREALLHNNLV